MMPGEDTETQVEKELDKLIHKSYQIYSRVCTTDMSDAHKKIFGQCGSCKHLLFAESEFNVLFAKCGCFDVMIHRKEPIVKCSSYEEIGTMTLWDMKAVASIINPDKKTMGFIIPPDRS
jgi:hypothetical protein